MIIEELKNINSTKAELKKFGLTIGIVLLVISAILFYKSNGLYKGFITAGIILIIAGLTFPVLLKPIHKIWMGFSVLLGWFSTRIILSILFYFVLAPIKLIAKISGKEFLDKKISKDRKSYWHYRDSKQFNPEDCEKQF